MRRHLLWHIAANPGMTSSHPGSKERLRKREAGKESRESRIREKEKYMLLWDGHVFGRPLCLGQPLPGFPITVEMTGPGAHTPTLRYGDQTTSSGAAGTRPNVRSKQGRLCSVSSHRPRPALRSRHEALCVYCLFTSSVILTPNSDCELL